MKIQKKAPKKFELVLSPQQDVVHPSLSGRSQADLGSGCFTLRQDGKVQGQAVNC